MDGQSLPMDRKRAEMLMGQCLDLAREAADTGNYALGVLVVRDDEVLASATSQLIDGHDPSAHPEMVALRVAADAVKSRYLPGAYLVTTLEPCVMCTGAAIWAKLHGVVFGASQKDATRWSRRHPDERFTWRQIRISSQKVARKGEPRLDVMGGVLRDECLKVFALSRRAA
jgi:tRNA(adenine34) deaminase